ncbi:GAF domain-containing protein [Dermatophilaceae bacterium Soc4.6]
MKHPTATDPTPDPVTDVARLTEVGRYDFDAPALKSALAKLAREAAEMVDLPIGLVSIVLGRAQFFAGSFGLDGTWMGDAGGSAVEWSFCANAVRSGEPYVVEDAAADPLQHDNPLVLLDGVRSYLGAPLISPSGQVLGTCCTIGHTRREFTASEVAALQELSARIVDELQDHVIG